VKTTQPQQDRTSNQEPQPPTHRIMACLSKYREYREQFDRLQLIEEDFFTCNFDEVEGVTSEYYRFLSSPSLDILTLDSDTDSD
jgi:hypothetical protein